LQKFSLSQQKCGALAAARGGSKRLFCVTSVLPSDESVLGLFNSDGRS
jgi:hypothetical protein